MTHEQAAIEYAQHYFRLIAEKAGVKWDSDNDAEVALMIQSIIAAAKEE